MANAGLDPLDAVLARVDLEATRDTAPPPSYEMSNLELMRRLGYILCEAARKIGVAYSDFGWDFEGLAKEIVHAAQGGGKLSPAEYRTAYTIWSIFHRQSVRLQQQADVHDDEMARTAAVDTPSAGRPPN
jgi:hypothetical protein